MRKKKIPLTFVEKMQKRYLAGMTDSSYIDTTKEIEDDILSIEFRVKKILNISFNQHRVAAQMLFFIMYDIENNKVRTQVSKYLLAKGCTRVQKSIFLADVDRRIFEDIRSDLSVVQQCYDNEDSILLVPISTDYLQSMKIIGKMIDVDIVLKSKNTLFF